MGKRLLILGGARYAMPIIEAAHALGAEAYTCDYLPDNFAHAHSDGYINASVVDKEAVLRAAESINADGIMSFACDPGVVSAAYAAEKLCLPFQGSYEAVSILQDKQRFRTFLRENGFNCPEVHIFDSVEKALAKAADLPYPMIAKPVDSAGSKGCARIDGKEGLERAVEYALSFSLSGRCIVEQFLEKACDTSDSDSFLVEGRFRCISFTSQLFDPKVPNPYTPAAYTMPSEMPSWAQNELRSELQRLADLLNLGSGIFNIETRVASDGRAYIMECSPRGGGNRLAEMLRFATGGKTDLIRASVEAALDESVACADESQLEGFWYQLMLHADHPGTFMGVEYAPGFKEGNVVEEQIWVEEGDCVDAFSAANHAFGSLMIRFRTQGEIKAFLAHPEASVRVLVS